MSRKLSFIVVAGFLLYAGLSRFGPNIFHTSVESLGSSDQELASAFESHRSGFQVTGEGEVTRILPDDNEGGRHQRFIIRLGTGQTLLIAHNIDLAPRINALRVDDSVMFSGEYEWNLQGGVIHWTHHDPAGHHIDGWIKHGGQSYQ